jgi:hypothetical protein
MRKLLAASVAILALNFGLMTSANAVSDLTGDFLSSFTGNHDADLDVTDFSAGFDSGTSSFLLDATLAGSIDPALAGLYVIGVNTGTGAIAPFGGIGAPNVIFDQVVLVNKDGTGLVPGPNGGPLDAGAITINGNKFTAVVPLSLLPSTGFDPLHYGFNLWPRNGLGTNDQIADFAPNNATLTATAVPEPASWGMLIAGFGVIGAALRRRKTVSRLDQLAV